MRPADVVRVVTYNVRGFRDGRARVASVVSGLRPDVLLLQETGPRRDLRWLADRVGMRVAPDPRSPLRRRVKNAVLLSDPWRFASAELIRFPSARRWYPRGALVARAICGDHAVWALSAHFGLVGAERGRQAESLVRLVGTLNGGLVIAGGDLNAMPEMAAVAHVASALRDSWSLVGEGDGSTFPAIAPTARIDYVFVGEGGEVVSAAVGAERASEASDHLPVTVDVRLAAG